MKINAQVGQTVLDISAQGTGTIENIFSVAKTNGQRSITSLPEPGEPFEIDDSLDVVEKSVLDYYKQRKIIPGTVGDAAPLLSGIDYDLIPTPIY